MFIKHFITDHRAPLLTIEVGLALGIGLSFILLLLIILSFVPRHLKGGVGKVGPRLSMCTVLTEPRCCFFATRQLDVTWFG